MKFKISFLFLLFVVAFSMPLSESQKSDGEIAKELYSEIGNTEVRGAQPILVGYSDNNKKVLSENGQNMADVRKTEENTYDISGSTGISALLFVSSLFVVFFIMYRACR